MTPAAPPAPKPGFPWRRLLRDARYAVGFNLLCAVLITVLTGAYHTFWYTLLASMCIGGIAFLLIDGARLRFWGDRRRPRGWPFFALVVVAVPIAQTLGMNLFSLLTGENLPGMLPLTSRQTTSTLAFTLLITGGSVLFFSSREKISRLQAEAAEEKARAESIQRQALQAQLQLLQAQIEPHMLFNTLANLQGLIGFDPDRAQLLLDQLIQYLRATLTSSRAQTTTLGQEFSLMQAYLGLMQIRMGARLTFALDLPEPLRQLKLPPMLLQPLVENAIQHGLEPKIEGGHIAVGAHLAGPSLVLTIADSGLGLDHPGQSKGTHLGLSNIRERLLALYAGAARLSLDAAEPCGAIAVLTLPIATTTIATTS